MPKVKTYHFKTSTPRQFIGRNYKLKVSEKSLKNETFWRFKIRRGPKLEGRAFANFGNSSGIEGKPSQKREKNGVEK